VHVAQFLHPLARRPDVEIVEALLPHVLRRVLEEIGLRRMAVPALLGQDAPRKTKFQSCITTEGFFSCGSLMSR
jgi:hypothetical protein